MTFYEEYSNYFKRHKKHYPGPCWVIIQEETNIFETGMDLGWIIMTMDIEPLNYSKDILIFKLNENSEIIDWHVMKINDEE